MINKPIYGINYEIKRKNSDGIIIDIDNNYYAFYDSEKQATENVKECIDWLEKYAEKKYSTKGNYTSLMNRKEKTIDLVSNYDKNLVISIKIKKSTYHPS